MVDRRSFSIKQRLAIYTRQNGLCAICGLLMPHGQFEIDHELALIAGGDNSGGNLRAVHPKCHSDKTGDDVRSHKKVQRTMAGGKKRKGRKIPYRLFDGTPVWR